MDSTLLMLLHQQGAVHADRVLPSPSLSASENDQTLEIVVVFVALLLDAWLFSSVMIPYLVYHAPSVCRPVP